MKRVVVIVVLLVVSAGADAQVKVGGQEIVPKGLVFAESDPKSRVTAEGELEDGCGWSFEGSTRFAEQRVETDCYLDYRRTSMVLSKNCPPPAKPEVVVGERTTTAARPRCPGDDGEIPPPEVETRAISSGSTPDGKMQAILDQPDGTRVTMAWDATIVRMVIRFPDGTTDILQVASEKTGAEAAP